MLGLLLILSCGSSPDESWRDQLAPAGPCWSVNLRDGLDESSTAELRSLYGCLNQGGNLDPVAGTVDALDAPVRSGQAAGIALAGLVNRLPDLGIDVLGLAGFALEIIEEDPQLVRDLLAVWVELLYGEPYADAVAAGPDPAASALDAGVIRPLLSIAPEVSGAVLDGGDAVPGLLADALAAPEAADGVCLLVGMAGSPDGAVSGLAADLLPDLGHAVHQARQAENDRWTGASGDSLRDLAVALLADTGGDGQTLLEVMGPDLRILLEDEALRGRLYAALADADAGGHLAPLPGQLLYLAEVDADGGSLDPGEMSALQRLLRMLHAADAPLECSVSVLGLELVSLDVDNLAEDLLRLLAQQSPQAVADGVSLLGGALEWSITQTVLDAVVDSGACPLLDAELAGDLAGIDRLSDPEVADLVVVMLGFLGAVYQETAAADRIPELVDVLGVAHARGAVPPVEEALRDLASSALVADVVDLVPVLLDPSDLPTDGCPTGATPLDLAGLQSIAAAALDPGAADQTPIQVLEPALLAALYQQGTWTALGNLADLAVADEAQLQALPALAQRIVARDPDLSLLYGHIDLLRDPTLYEPALQILESEAVIDALSRAELTSEGPLPWSARLVADDTIPDLLRTIDLVMDAVR